MIQILKKAVIIPLYITIAVSYLQHIEFELNNHSPFATTVQFLFVLILHFSFNTNFNFYNVVRKSGAMEHPHNVPMA